MPLMDAFRQHWPEVELDLVSGFHSDPVKLLEEGGADVVIGSEISGGAALPTIRYSGSKFWRCWRRSTRYGRNGYCKRRISPT